MPSKNGMLTPQERVFAERMAATGDARYAAEKAGYAHPIQRAASNLAKPAVNREIHRRQVARLFNEALPLAVDLVIDHIQDRELAPQHRQSAAKLVFQAVKGFTDEGADRAIEDMHPDEYARAIAEALQRVTAEKTRLEAELIEPVDVDVAAPAPAAAGVFG